MDFTMPLPTMSVISTTLSSPERAGGLKTRGAAVAPGAAALAAATGAAAAAWATGAGAAAASKSASITRPTVPVPVTVFRSMPICLARARILGVARTPGAFVLAPGVLTTATARAAGAAVAAGAAATAGAAVGEGAAAVADPAVWISTRVAPTFTVPPTWEWSFTTLPVKGLVSSTEALSLSTEHRLSISFTSSPSFTNHSVSCTSAMPSPMSANLKASSLAPEEAAAGAAAAGAAFAGEAGALAAGAPPPSEAMSTNTSPTFTVPPTL
mmetsp:Transcript_26060/g.46193  ORF Transcript_26060/g.46193 Transcript_26060/m.46193 type:complete len:269 (+) Transcript_26060:916-1722(+)